MVDCWKFKIIPDGVEVMTRKSQTSLQFIQVSSKALLSSWLILHLFVCLRSILVNSVIIHL